MNEAVGKDNSESEFALTPPDTQAIVKRSKPTLVVIGKNLTASDGRWHPDLVAEYIRDHGGRERWISIGELARVFFWGNTPSNKKRVRQRLFRIGHRLLDQSLLLVIDFDPKSTASIACKIYDPRSQQERVLLRGRLERMERLKLLKADQVHRAITLAECLDQALELDNDTRAQTDAG